MGKVNGGELFYTIDLQDNTAKKLKTIEDKISKLQASLVIGIDNKDALAKLQTLIEQASKLRDTLKETGKGTMSDMTNEASKLSEKVAEVNKHQKETTASTVGAAAATIDYSSAMTKVAEESDKVNWTMRSLGTVIAEVFSIATIKNFLTSLVEVGGQIQKQRLAMSAIFGSQYKSEQLFSQLRGLALKSPYGIVELDQYSKQLSAFDIQFNEIYDTVKRLADISSGVGVDIQRIINAYGHVKAQHFLDGMVLRQFTKANIPMLDALAERFEKLEGHVVTAGDVIQRVHDKLVTFEDVQGALKDLTDEGGIFYNMQETVSQAVSVKYKNMRDAIDLMYNDIASSNNTVLALPAELLTNLIKHWRQYAKVLEAVGGAYAIYKTYVLAASLALTKQTQSVMANMLVEKKAMAVKAAQAMIAEQNERAMLTQKAASDGLTASEARRLAVLKANYQANYAILTSSKKLTAQDYQLMATTGALNKEKLMYLITMKKIDAATAQEIVKLGLLKDTEVAAAMSTRKFAAYLKMAGTNLKSFFSANWLTIAGAGILAIGGWLWGAYEENENRVDSIKKQMEDANEDLVKTTNEIWRNVSIKGSDVMTNMDLSQGVDEMVEYLRDNVSVANEVLQDVFKLDDNGIYKHTLKERYDMLKDYIEKIKNLVNDEAVLYDFSTDVQEILNYATNSMSGDLHRAAEVYADNVREFRKRLLNSFDKDSDLTSVIIEQLQGRYGKETIPTDITKSALVNFIAQHAEAIDIAMQNLDKRTQQSLDYYQKGTANGLRRFSQTSQKYFKELAQKFKEDIGHAFDPNNGDDRLIMNQIIDNWLKAATDLDDVVKNLIGGEMTNKEYQIKLMTILEGDEGAKEVIEARGALDRTLFLHVKTDMPNMGTFASKIFNAAAGTDILEAAKQNADAMNSLKTQILKDNAAFLKNKTLQKLVNPLTDKKFNPTKITPTQGLDGLDLESIQAYNDEVERYLNMQKKAKEAGLDYSDDGDKNKTSTRQRQEDKVLKSYRNQLSIIKDAYQTFKKYQDVYGMSGAGEKMSELGLFGELLGEKGTMTLDEYIKKLDDLRIAFEKVVGNSEERKKLLADIAKLENDAVLEKEKNRLKSQLEIEKQQMAMDEKRWSLYKEFLRATGDKGKAYSAAFGTDDTMRGFEDIQEYISDAYQRFLRSKGLQSSLNLADMFTFDTERLRDEFGENADVVKLYIDSYKKAFEASQSETSKLYQESLKQTMDYSQKMLKIWNDYADKIKAAQDNGDMQTANRLTAQRDMEMAKGSLGFTKFLQGLGTWSKEAIQVYADTLRDLAMAEYQATGDAAKLEKELKTIDDAVEKLKKKTDEQWLQKGGFKGLSGLKDYYKAKANNGTITVGETKLMNTIESLENTFTKVSGIIESLSGAWGEYSKLAEAFGVDDDEIFKAGDAVVKTATSLNDAFKKIMSGDIVGGAMTALTEPVVIWAKYHDEKLQKQIELLQKQNQQLQWMGSMIDKRMEYSLLGRNTDIKDILGYRENRLGLLNSFFRPSAQYEDAYKKGGAYGVERAMLEEQIKNLEEINKKESEKSNSDNDAITQNMQQIEELKQEVRDYALEIANTVYGIDLKQWSSDLTSALVDSWAEGTDAAKAYGDAVADIMRDLMTNVLNVSIMQPALQDLQKLLVGDDGKGGLLGTDLELTADEIPLIAKELMNVKDKSEKVKEAMDKFAGILDMLGIDLRGDEQGQSLANSIAGIKEEQADLLASYVNAIRADVSVQRGLFAELTTVQMPELNAIAQSQLQQLSQIQMNTLRNADTADGIYDTLRSVLDGGSRRLQLA